MAQNSRNEKLNSRLDKRSAGNNLSFRTWFGKGLLESINKYERIICKRKRCHCRFEHILGHGVLHLCLRDHRFCGLSLFAATPAAAPALDA
jgi:hypothetical protein